VETSFEIKCDILAELWLSYRDEENFADFIQYNDLGLPLAYCVANGIVEVSGMAEGFIEEAWRLLLEGFGLEDTGFDNLEDLLDLDGNFPMYTVDSSEGEEEEDEDEDSSVSESYELGFKDGATAEQRRVQDIVVMQKRWAKENRKGNEFLFWDSVGEVLTPIQIDYSEEAYKRSLEADGF
jgi:hypothetical protein